MSKEERLQELLASDELGSGTREEWRELALRLRVELDELLDHQRRPMLVSFGVGTVVGMALLGCILYFRWYRIFF
jgi:hypothetical protein